MRQLLLDWSQRPALQVGLLLELVQLAVVLPPRVRLAVAVAALVVAVAAPVVAVAAPVPSLCQAAAAPQLPDSPAPEQPDSYHRLPAALVPEAELARAKPTQTRL